MPIIIISSNSILEERKIAEKIKDATGFNLLGPQILPDIEKKYHIDNGGLSDALETTPSFIEKIVSNKWRCRLACLEAEVLGRLQEKNVVCWGLSAHLYVVGVSHALKVRVWEPDEKIIMRMTKEQGLSKQKAERILETEYGKRRKWSQAAYDKDENDSSLFDLLINLEETDIDEVAQTILYTSEYRKFQPITYSIKNLSDLALAAKVRTTLLKSMDDIRVEAKDGTVLVYTKAFKQKKIDKIKTIKDLAGQIEGVEYVEVHVTKQLFGDSVETAAY